MADSGSEWQAKALGLAIPAIMAIAGWAFSMEGRLQRTIAQQEERGPRIAHLEQMVEDVAREVHDPAPKPETKVALDGLSHDLERLDEQVTRLEGRINALHQFLLQSPLNPPFNTMRRGDILDFVPQKVN